MTATATKTSRTLKKRIRVTSNFIARIPSRVIRQMRANVFGVEFLRTVSKFRKRKRKLSSCVPALNKREIRHFHVVVGERQLRKNTKKRDAPAKLLFC